MNLINGLGAIGSFAQGTRDYELYDRKKQADAQSYAINQMAFQQAQKKNQDQIGIDGGYLDINSSEFQDWIAKNGIPKPPVRPQDPIPPSTGDASTAAIATAPQPQPAQAQFQPPQGHQNNQLMDGLKMRADKLQTIQDPRERQSFINSVFGNINAIPNPQQRNQMGQMWNNVAMQSQQAPQGQGQPMQGQGQPAPIAPYQSMANAGQAAVPDQAQIAAPPKMNLDEAVKFLRSKGKDDSQIVAILDKNTARLSAEGQQRLAVIKEQELSDYHKGVNRIKEEKLAQDAPLTKAKTDNYIGLTDDRPLRTKAIQDNVSARASAGGSRLSEAQNEALFGVNGAVAQGKIDPNRINSRTDRMFADAFIKNPNADFAKISADINLSRNPGFRQKAMTAEVLPEIMQNMVDSGKKIGFSDIKTIGKMQAWVKGETNDPDMTEYMVQRNDALMTIAGVMRGAGMTDMAHHAETEVSSPTMSPAALDAWMKGQMKSLEPRLKLNREIIKNKPSQGADASSAPKSTSGTASTIVLSSASELQAAIKSGKLKKGDTFNDPNGNPHTVN
ncbi:hypothetical protein [Glaciimonas immobilis]|uniref:Uncharacterized protein n=1 Tax=Glaciimonas immobilis TaxID=728004 RepID=A0A840RW22_9BURK|nr:hypothetical protein [Glaciimonas immobilis]KAF3997553.1 hypothetical protein HAV38_12810 [Glaciimonas immobilis]MBB5200761.1 hypothetical protein [Glaciimonas immobilis]